YVLATRLPSGLLLLLRPDGYDRRDPFRVKFPDFSARFDGFRLLLHGPGSFALAFAKRHRVVDGLALVFSVEVRAGHPRRDIWSWFFNRKTARASIDDDRDGDSSYGKNLTDDEIERLKCPTPAFGEFDALAQIVLEILRTAGFDELS